LAHGQASLSKTTLGKSQNDERDLANSLVVPNRPHHGREKTEQVDTQKLPTKAIKDPKFQGSLLDEGLDSSAETKSQDEKGVNASEKDSKVSKQPATSGDKDSKVSKSTDSRGDGQNKDQKAASAKSDEKAPEKEKASASKTDGHH